MAQPLNKAKTRAFLMLSRKKYRQIDGLFPIEGPNLLDAALACGWPLAAVLAQAEALKSGAHRELFERVRQSGVPLYELTDRQVALLSDTETPQGILAIARMPKAKFDAATLRRAVMLVDAQDPANVAAVIRAAWCLGYGDVVLAGSCADPYAPKVVRGSAGGIFHVRIHAAKSAEAVIERCKDAAVTVLCAAAGARDFATVTAAGPLLLVLGNERRGLPEAVRRACHETVSIPMAPSAESLNLSVAAGVLMQRYARPVEQLAPNAELLDGVNAKEKDTGDRR